jgi:chorismate mutase
MYKSFETERLVLIPTTEEDAEFVLRLLNSPKWIKYIGDRNVKSVEDAKAYIRNKIQPQFERLGYGNYTVIRKSDNVKIGTCGLYDREGIEGIDIGFALLSEYENMGYAFESSNKIKQVGIEDFGLTQIKAITTTDNIASQKLLKRLVLRKADIDNNILLSSLEELRHEIDKYDDRLVEIFELRMAVASKIGLYKKQNNITILQTSRWDEILKHRIEQAARKGLSEEFIIKVFRAIHEESINHQTKVMNEE